MRRRLVAAGLVLVGFVLEATSIISMGGGIRFRAALRPAAADRSYRDARDVATGAGAKPSDLERG